MTGDTAKSCAVIVGVGAREGIGGAMSVLAASKGLHVFVAGRTAARINRIVEEIHQNGGEATAIATDSTDEQAVKALFEKVAASGLPLELVVYNTGGNYPSRFLNTSEVFVEGHWRRCVLGGFLTGQAALKIMLPQGRGSIIYTGATASVRGRPLFGAFASAKAGLRAMAQSMAREFGPQGIHVAHVIIDGTIEGEVVRKFMRGLGWLVLRKKGKDGGLLPDQIARNYWAIHAQPRSAWTQELDLRPFKEVF